MDETEPIGNIEPQILDTLPIPTNNTLVNDTIALVNDTSALVGSQTTQIQSLRVTTSNNAPKASISQRR